MEKRKRKIMKNFDNFVKLNEEKYWKKENDSYIDSLIGRLERFPDKFKVDYNGGVTKINFDTGENVQIFDKAPTGYKKHERVHLFHPKSGGGGVLTVSDRKVEELLDTL